MSLLPGEAIITRIWDLFFPDKSSVTKADFELKAKAIDAEITRMTLASQERAAQAATNTAEADNQNRKWATWREMIGYAGAASIWWNYVLQPVIVMISQLSGHPVDQATLVQLNIADLLGIICGMLGISYAPTVATGTINYVAKTVNAIKNRNK